MTKYSSANLKCQFVLIKLSLQYDLINNKSCKMYTKYTNKICLNIYMYI